jgi:hypothetical protein
MSDVYSVTIRLSQELYAQLEARGSHRSQYSTRYPHMTRPRTVWANHVHSGMSLMALGKRCRDCNGMCVPYAIRSKLVSGNRRSGKVPRKTMLRYGLLRRMERGRYVPV